jgi:hypothetical protein
LKNGVFVGQINFYEEHKWNKIENSLEISGFHHNAFGGFLGIRIGLCSLGEGSISFKNFNYTPLK